MEEDVNSFVPERGSEGCCDRGNITIQVAYKARNFTS
jgi:hypothetical protein